ncbi:MAG: permease [Deltaproteobacteria bacterium RIFOXYD12_FULL_57_12]|nr:MAG: permease [Deltaproteobacteria bacterium RIFOXYD12_FULL_57_12]
MSLYILLSLIFLAASFTQGLTGFGFGLLAIPLLTLLIDIKIAIPLCSLQGLLITGFLSLRLKRHIDHRKILPLLLGCLPGIAVGVIFLKKAPTWLLGTALGWLLIAYSLFWLCFRPRPVGMHRLWAYVAGFGTGAISSAFSAGGPPAIIYTTLTGWSKDDVKATLSGFFLACGLFIVAAHAASGLTTITVLRYFGISAPAVILGMVAGSTLYDRVDTENYLRLLLCVLLGMGILLLRTASGG